LFLFLFRFILLSSAVRLQSSDNSRSDSQFCLCSIKCTHAHYQNVNRDISKIWPQLLARCELWHRNYYR